MKIKLLVSIAVLILIAAPAMADVQLRMDSFQADLSITAGTSSSATGSITIGTDGILNIDLESFTPPGPPFTDIDNAQMLQNGVSPDDFLLTSLSFTRVAADVWSATGLLTVADTVGTKVIADFTATSISITTIPGATPGSDSHFLTMAGLLTPSGTNSSILVNGTPGGAWAFAGEEQKASFDPSNGLDTVENQVTIPVTWEKWGEGTLVELHHQVGVSSLDTFFGVTQTYSDGQLNVTITPIPGAVLLGILGLGVAGLKLRKFA